MIENVGDCIWKIAGPEAGPTIVVFGGIHGNELTGIEVVRKMYREIEQGELIINRGTLYLILGNPKAIVRNTRGSEDHADLNRCFKKDVLEQSDPLYERQRAKEIAMILVDADISIDLHATNKPSVPFLCCLADEKHEKVYKWFDCDRVLADPRYILAKEPVTTDEFLDAQGGTGVCYETGFVGDLTRVDHVFENVMNVLRDQGVVTAKTATLQKTDPKKVFELIECIYLTEAGFVFADGRGLGSFEEFKFGDEIGRIGNEPLVAEYDGVVVFPKLPEFQALGKPVVYLAKQVR